MSNKSSLLSWMAPSLDNYVEGEYIDRDFKAIINLIELGFKRLKRIFCFQEICSQFVQDVFRFKYENFSYFCLVSIELWVFFFHLENLLDCIFIVITIIVLVNQPIINDVFCQHMNYIFFSQTNPKYKAPLIKTIS